MRLTIVEAAHKVRMTVTLLEWASKNSLKRDGQKLIIDDGYIDEAQLASFDSSLRTPWSNKNPGKEILREIEREARGRCGLCKDKTDAVEIAHIDRFGIELEYHCQHPHNLIRLCSTCHTRYDVKQELENSTIRHAKQQLLAELMADVDVDVRLNSAIQQHLGAISTAVAAEVSRQVKLLSIARDLTQHIETLVTGSAAPVPRSPAEAGQRLAAISGSISEQNPVTSHLLLKYTEALADGSSPPRDLTIDALYRRSPDRCEQCDAQTRIDNTSCSECDQDAGDHELWTAVGDGTYNLHDEDLNGVVTDVTCDDCGANTFHVEFNSLCDGCEHMWSRANEPD